MEKLWKKSSLMLHTTSFMIDHESQVQCAVTCKISRSSCILVYSWKRHAFSQNRRLQKPHVIGHPLNYTLVLSTFTDDSEGRCPNTSLTQEAEEAYQLNTCLVEKKMRTFNRDKLLLNVKLFQLVLSILKYNYVCRQLALYSLRTSIGHQTTPRFI